MNTPGTTPDRIRSLRLPSTVSGKPEDVCREVLAPLFGVTANVHVICGSLEPNQLAQLTLGFASLIRAAVSLTIVAVVDDAETPPATILEELRNKWAQTLQVRAAAHRLSVYHFFADQQQLRICIRSPEDFGTHSPIYRQLSEGCGIILAGDDTGTAVEIVWREIPKLGQQTEVDAEIKWSFGDPLKHVLNTCASVQQIISTNSSSQGREIEAELASLIRALPPLVSPWDEKFEEVETLSFRLYPHQEIAVEAWLQKNGRGIFKMCTGAGKTISAIFASRLLGQRELDAGRRCPPVIITVPTRILADQWTREIERLGFRKPLDAYNSVENWHQKLEPMMKADGGREPRFIVSTYRTFADERFQTKLRKVAAAGVRALWIGDEMHNLASPRLMRVMESCVDVFVYRLGLSATPDIEGNSPATDRLRTFFGDICQPVYELRDGIAQGVLCQYNYYPVPAYLAPQIGERYLEILQNIGETKPGSPGLVNFYRESRELLRTSGVQVAKFRELLEGLRSAGMSIAHTLVYCPPGYGTYGDEVSDEIDKDFDERRLLEEVIETLRDHGVATASVLGETPTHQRGPILERFADGRVEALCAIGCLDEGVDVPSIKRAIVLYSIDRERQFVQRRGRILRKPRGSVDKIAEIYDVIILPQGSSMPSIQAQALLEKEMRRYRTFAQLALNKEDAENRIRLALDAVTEFAPQI